MKNRELMSKGNPFKAVIIFAIPSIISMTVNSIYNIVDKIFIGKYVGSVALEGLQVVNPLMFISFALMVMVGLGSASYASNKLGEHHDDEANQVFNNSFILDMAFALVIEIVYFSFAPGLLKLSGATDENYQYAFDYFMIIVFGFIFQGIAHFFMMNIRSEGRPTFSMFTQMTGCIVNIIFDYIFIGPLGMGVKGAAIATVMGHMSNAIVGFIYYLCTKIHYFQLKPKMMFQINWHFIGQVLTIGLSSMILNVCTGTATIIFNRFLSKYQDGLSILAILTSLDSLCIMPCVGIRQGLLPIFSYNYGEKNYPRMFTVFKVGALYGIGYGIVFALIIALFPTFFISFFVNASETRIITEATRICRFYYIGIVLVSLNMNTSAMYQSSRQKIKASILSAMRQCLYLIPLLFLMDGLFAFDGIWFAIPISDALSGISSLALYYSTKICFRKTGFLCRKDYQLALKGKNDS